MDREILLRKPALLGVALLLILSSGTGHAVWRWLQGSAISDFKDADWELLQQAAEEVLNEKPDGEQVNWSNPDTGNRGSIMALATFSHEGRTCRRAAIRNLSVRGREGRASISSRLAAMSRGQSWPGRNKAMRLHMGISMAGGGATEGPTGPWFQPPAPLRRPADGRRCRPYCGWRR